MKFQLAATTIFTASLAASAFMVPGNYIQKKQAITKVVASPDQDTKTERSASNNRPVFDPMGLYPESSEEVQQGRIQQLEPNLDVKKPVIDPMGLYPPDSQEYKEYMELEKIYNGGPYDVNGNRPVFDPMGLYSETTQERQMGKIQAMEPKEVNAKDTKDPLGLYPKESVEFERSLEYDKEMLNRGNEQFLYDPLGLYPESSPERQEGRVRALEPEVKAIKPVLDPLGLYNNADQREQEVDQGVIMSEALPFVPRPASLDGSLAGDFGFDPLGFSNSPDSLGFMRQAELKHARIAMLAAAGWPLSELFDKKIAALLHLKPLLVEGDRVPSLLNGGLSQVNPFYWMGILAVAGLAEGLELMRAKDGWAVPISEQGGPGFDPLGLFPKDEAGQKKMQLSEIKNGRLAMVAITAFAVMEALTKTAVVDFTPFFFHPPF